MKRLNTAKFDENLHVLHNTCKLIKLVSTICDKDKGDINKFNVPTFKKLEQVLYNLVKIFSTEWMVTKRDVRGYNVTYYVVMNLLPQLLKYADSINVILTPDLFPLLKESRSQLKEDKNNRTLLINTIWIEFLIIIRYVLDIEDDFGNSTCFKYFLNLLCKESPNNYSITDLERVIYKKELDYDIKSVEDMERFNHLIYTWDYKAIYNVLNEQEIARNREFLLDFINMTVEWSSNQNLETFLTWLSKTGNFYSENIWTQAEIYKIICEKQVEEMCDPDPICKLKLWEFLDNYKNSESNEVIRIINGMFSKYDKFDDKSKRKINEILVRRGGSIMYKMDNDD